LRLQQQRPLACGIVGEGTGWFFFGTVGCWKLNNYVTNNINILIRFIFDPVLLIPCPIFE